MGSEISTYQTNTKEWLEVSYRHERMLREEVLTLFRYRNVLWNGGVVHDLISNCYYHQLLIEVHNYHSTAELSLTRRTNVYL